MITVRAGEMVNYRRRTMEAEDYHPDLRNVARWLPRTAVGPRSLKPVRALSAFTTL